MVTNGSEQQRWLDKTRETLLSSSQAVEFHVSVNYVTILIEFLQGENIDTTALLKLAAIETSLLKDPKASIDGSQYENLMLATVKIGDNPILWGLEYGRRLTVFRHGLLGYAIMSSANIIDALSLAAKYIQGRNSLISFNFSLIGKTDDKPERVSMGFDVNLDNIESCRFQIDAIFSALIGVWKEMLGNSDGIEAFYCSFPEPKNAGLYKKFFDVPVLFDQPRNCVVFDPKAFEAIARQSDPMLHSMAEQQCKTLLEEIDKQQPEREQGLELDIRQLLLKSPGNFLTQHQVAQTMGITARTLTRRLTRKDLSFKNILDDVRKQLALQCLQTTEWSVDEIAAMLNYSDASNFSRAVKRWTGKTPGQFRQDKS